MKAATMAAFTSHMPCQPMPSSMNGDNSIMIAMPIGIKVDQMPMATGTSLGRAAPAMIFGAQTVTAT